MTPREKEVIRHALGLTISDTEYRNYFVAGPKDVDVWDGLVAQGFAERGAPTKGWKVFHVTDAGREAVTSQQRSDR